MSTKLNRHGYEQLIAGDLDWLRGRKKTLERDHVIQIVEDSVRAYYEVEPLVASLQTALVKAVEALDMVRNFEHEYECNSARRRCRCSAGIFAKTISDAVWAARPLLPPAGEVKPK